MKQFLTESVEFLISHLLEDQKNLIRVSSGLDPHKRSFPTYKPSSSSSTLFGIAPFFVECGGKVAKRVGGVGGEGEGDGMCDLPFSFSAPTTSRNVSRLLRGLFSLSFLFPFPFSLFPFPFLFSFPLLFFDFFFFSGMQLPKPLLLEGSPGVGKSIFLFPFPLLFFLLFPLSSLYPSFFLSLLFFFKLLW